MDDIPEANSLEEIGEVASNAIVQKLLRDIKANLAESLNAPQPTKAEYAAMVEKHLKEVLPTMSIDGAIVDNYTVVHHNKGVVIFLKNEDKVLDTKSFRSARIGRVYAKGCVNTLAIFTFTGKPSPALNAILRKQH